MPCDTFFLFQQRIQLLLVYYHILINLISKNRAKIISYHLFDQFSDSAKYCSHQYSSTKPSRFFIEWCFQIYFIDTTCNLKLLLLLLTMSECFS